MRHRIPTIALTVALAGGALLAAAPAQAAPAQQGVATVVADNPTDHRADIGRMRQQLAELRDKAVMLDQLGDHKGAQDARFLAALLQRMIDTLIASDQHG
ncbi:hypothetical protein F7Q99_27510 [Streptomyces kaniharaensis]|uniref:Uncharacterized protein n=1 Tax=Streptomyces kaniharaensis TaxID=212423 RepID=A0A6N7L157_9ACTN|nr:hypothetical protein [Streptomyces kaniharaensis]MQS15904.1 hypothetical protein [Streptomyces kaniharaensis]